MVTKRLFYWVLLAVLLGTLEASFSQMPNLRVGVTDDPFPGAMRPDTFRILKIGQIPLTADLENTQPLGAFRSRLGKTPEELGAKLGIDGRLHPRASTHLSAASTRTHLRLVIRCQEPHPQEMAQALDTYFPDDRIDVLLDLDHDHHRFTRISVIPRGESSQQTYQVHENHLAWDRGHRKIEGRIAYEHESEVDQAGWTLTLDVELPRIEDKPWHVVGLNVVRYRGVGGEETTMWCPDYNRVSAPLYFGDLYIGDAPAQVAAVSLGTVCWGKNKGSMEISASDSQTQLTVGSRNYKKRIWSKNFDLDGTGGEFEYYLDPHDLMYGAIDLSLNGNLWGSYHVGWKRGLLLTHRPGAFQGEEPTPKPNLGEEDYYWKFARYLLDRIPEFERSLWGMRLESKELMIPMEYAQNDPVKEIARCLMRLFQTDEERLAAAALILCQKGMMVSSGTGARLSKIFGGTGIIRNGAAFCGSYGELLRDVVNQMTDSNGKPFRAVVVNFKDGPVNTFGWPHHWLAGVAYGGGITLIDAELGTFFIHPESGKLVTLQELLEHPEWAERTSYGLSEYFRDRPIEDFYVREFGDLWEGWY